MDLLRKYIFILLALVVSAVYFVSAQAAPGASFFNEALMGGRNDYDGTVGHEFIMNADVYVTALGRPEAGMGHSHRIEVWDSSRELIVCSVVVTPESPSDGGFKYELIGEDIILQRDRFYRIVSYEYSGGDYWIDSGEAADGLASKYDNEIAFITGDCYGMEYGVYPIYQWQGAWGSPASTFVAPNFWFEKVSDRVVEIEEEPGEELDEPDDGDEEEQEIIAEEVPVILTDAGRAPFYILSALAAFAVVAAILTKRIGG